MLTMLAEPMQTHDLPAVTALVNAAAAQAPFSAAVTPDELHTLGLTNASAGVHPVSLQNDPAGWLVLRGRDTLLGFAHACVGRLSGAEAQAGFIRFLTFVPGRTEVGVTLLAAAERFLRGAGVRQLYAWHPHTGYPFYHAGVGVVNGQDFYNLSALGEAGFEMTGRLLCYQRLLTRPTPEQTPALRLRTLFSAGDAERWTALTYRPNQAQPCGQVEVICLPAYLGMDGKPLAYLRRLDVQEEAQRQGIGRWLLQRTCNEFYGRGFAGLAAHVQHQQLAAQRTLPQAGFEELSFRGYSFERTLAD